MPISIARLTPAAVDVRCDADVSRLTLADGREISAPMEWFPRLREPGPEQREQWRPIGRGERIQWQDIDEVNALLGLPS